MHSLLRIIQLSIKTEYLKAGITRKSTVLAFNTLCILSLVNIVMGSTFNEVIYVDDDNLEGPWDGTERYPYCSIQDAIDASHINSTIIVKNGTYYENVFINKTLSLFGEDKHLTIIDGQNKDDTVYIDFFANEVSISGFTISHCGKLYGGGDFDGGLDIHSDNNCITDNIFTNNHMAGIILFGSSNNIIDNNIFLNSNRSGIEFISGRFNIISNNTIMNNPDDGIHISAMGNSIGNIITYNTFEKNRIGISVYHSDNKITCNDFFNSTVAHAVSQFNIWTLSASRNYWNANYWDNFNGVGSKYIRGFLGFNVDKNPVLVPYNLNEGGS